MHLLSARELREKFVSGEVSARQIAEHFLGRIGSLDEKIGAYLQTLEERVLAQADRLDEKRAKGEKLGKLAGVPVSLKDNMQIKGEITTCGSKFLENYRAPFDATIVELMEKEDALILGKTNLDEFAMGSSNEHSAFKKVFNPWNLKCSPGGSSGGSAAAVAARMTPFSLGSDTGGSIRQPAALCGVVGFKPTYGRVSRYGLVAFGSSLDQIGPFATRVSDIGMLMEVLGQHCDRDSTSIPSPAEEYTFEGDVKGVKIGVPWKFLDELEGEARENFDQSIATLKKLGAEIVDIDLSILKYSVATYYVLSTAEASTNLARFDGVRYGLRSEKAESLDEIYDLSKEEGFGREVKRRILLGTYVLSSGYKDAYYRKAQQVRTVMIDQFRKVFEECDLVATPVSPFPAFELGGIRDPLQMYLCDLYTICANLVGLPAISVPSGFTKDEKPMALQLIGPQRADVKVCQAAHAFEEAASVADKLPEVVA